MNDHQANELLPCAFCGSAAAIKEIGNDHTKTRAVQVKCSNVECRVERTDKAMSHGMEWLRAVAVKNWNRRAAPTREPADRDAVLEEAAMLFPQPYMEYFGENIQAEIRALKSSPMPTIESERTRLLQFLTDVVTAAGLLSYGKTDKKLATRIADEAYRIRLSASPSPSVDQAKRLVGGEVAADWQPIETAPKDGTKIILGRPDDDFNELSPISTTGRWHGEDHDGPDNMGHDAGFMDDDYQAFEWGRSFGNPDYMTKGIQPTHWMPLPEAPDRASTGSATSTDTKESA